MKKVICIILSIVIFILLLILSINLSIEDIVVDTISDSMVSDKISDVVTDIIYEKNPDIDVEDMEKIEKLVENSEDVIDIAGSFFNAIIGDINDNSEKTIDISEELYDLIEDNKDKLEKYGINSEDIDDIKEKLVDNNNINDVYEVVEDGVSNHLTSDQRIVISIYNILSSNELRYGLIIGIIVNLIIIILLSGYKVIIYSGVSALVSGISVKVGIIGIIHLIAWNVTNKVLGRTSDINVSALSNIGWFYIIFGIILIIIYFCVKKFYSKKA